MTDYELNSGLHSIGLNAINTAGVMTVSELPENKRTKTYFDPQYLKEWAEMVADCYEDESHVEVCFHKDAPMLARVDTDEDEDPATLGLGVAPQLPPEVFNDEE